MTTRRAAVAAGLAAGAIGTTSRSKAAKLPGVTATTLKIGNRAL